MRQVKATPILNLAMTILLSSVVSACQPGSLFGLSGQAANSSSKATASITGILYTGGSDETGRLSPPEDRYTIELLDSNDKLVTSVESDANGRFYLGNIAAAASGTPYRIKIGSDVDIEKMLFAGRVLDLSAVKVGLLQNQLKRVSGILLNTSGQPLADAEVRDKSAIFRSTKTDATGRFSLEVKGEEIEIVNGLSPITITVDELKKSGSVQVDTTNIRSISGKVIDKTNSLLPLANVKIKVQGRALSTFSGEDGSFILNGAPVEPFVLEVDSPKGYSKFTVDVPPATFENQKPQNVTQNLLLNPVGTIQINFIAETAPGFDELPPIDNEDFDASNPESPPQICDSYINCFMFDLTGPNNPSRPEYDNGLAVLNPLDATVTVEGTGITQKVIYPPAPFRIIYGADPTTGDPVKVDDLARASNVVFSVTLPDIPGGKQSVTISMTGFQTQKSIPVYVPPNDIISTELITLYRVQPVSSFGDVKGVIKGTQPLPDGKQIRIVYLDVKEDLNYQPILGDRTNPDLLDAINEALDSKRYAVAKENTTGPDGKAGTTDDKFIYHEYYLKNVPTGSRIMLAAVVVNADETLSDCYIPNTSVLLNVRSSQINLAPDLDLTARPTESGCTR